MNLNNKIVVITGASSGIGLEISKILLQKNCKLALTARRTDPIDEVIKSFSGGLLAKSYTLDVTDKQMVKDVIKKVKGDFGSIDVAILNSGVSRRTIPAEFNSGEAEEIINTNLFGIIYCVEELLPDFKKEKRGMIAGVSSLADGRGFPRSGFYSASKAAATILLESLRIELKPLNIKVITVKPGFVKTPMTDKNEFHMPFLMNADKAAEIIVRGLEKEKSVIKFPLATSLSSGLLKLLPNRLFEFLASLKLPEKS